MIVTDIALEISYFKQPCACHNYYNQPICYCFDMNINYSLFNLPKKMFTGRTRCNEFCSKDQLLIGWF